MLIQKHLNLLTNPPPPQQGLGLSLTLFKGTSSLAPYMGIAQGKNLLALGFMGTKFSEEALRHDLCHRPAWRRATFQESSLKLEEIETLEAWGTPFQIKVWKTLYEQPPHTLTTYKEIGEKIGIFRGYQAIGQAVSRNPISFFIPCHLVIKTSGDVGEYYWGKELKEKLLHSLPQSVL